MSRDGRPEGHESPDHTSTAEFALGEKRVAGPPPVVGQGAGHGPASETVTDRPVDEIAGPMESAGVTAVDRDPMSPVTAAPPPAHSEAAGMPQTPWSGETRETIVEAAVRKPDGEPAETEEVTRENAVRAGAGVGPAGGDGWTVAPGLGGSTGAGPHLPFAEGQGQGQAHGAPVLSASSVPGRQSLPAGRLPHAGRNRRAVLVMVAVAAAALLGIAAAGILLWPETRPSAGRSSVAQGSQATPSTGPQGGTASPESGEPAGPGGTGPGGTPTPALPGEQGTGGTEAGGVPGADSANAAGPAQAPAEVPPLRSGDNVTYQLMQRDEGYFEGTFAITNPGSEPMPSWTLTFSVKGANVRNVWGGRLVRGGETAIIGNAPGAAAIPPGGSIEVRFGADGAPSDPATCEVNGRSCGF